MIQLIDYGAGNLTSVRKALSYLDAVFETPQVPADLGHATAIIVPGVGNFEATTALDGVWRQGIANEVDRGTPLLGICLGLQWLFSGSDEAPDVPGFGAIDGCCRLLEQEAGDPSVVGTYKVPHVGWNSLHRQRDSWILEGVNEGNQVYFTHSFAAPITTECVGATRYGIDFASVVEQDQLVGVQFHPEKSGDVGLRILKNFLNRINAS